jgi:hypothetical protein
LLLLLLLMLLDSKYTRRCFKSLKLATSYCGNTVQMIKPFRLSDFFFLF